MNYCIKIERYGMVSKNNRNIAELDEINYRMQRIMYYFNAYKQQEFDRLYQDMNSKHQKYFKRIRTSMTNTTSTFWEAVKAMKQSKDKNEQLSLWQQFWKASQNLLVRTNYQIAAILEEQGNVQQMERYINEGNKIQSDSDMSYYWRARLSWKKQDYRQAGIQLFKATKKNAQNIKVLLMLGQYFQKNEVNDVAGNYYYKVMELMEFGTDEAKEASLKLQTLFKNIKLDKEEIIQQIKQQRKATIQQIQPKSANTQSNIGNQKVQPIEPKPTLIKQPIKILNKQRILPNNKIKNQINNKLEHLTSKIQSEAQFTNNTRTIQKVISSKTMVNNHNNNSRQRIVKKQPENRSVQVLWMRYELIRKNKRTQESIEVLDKIAEKAGKNTQIVNRLCNSYINEYSAINKLKDCIVKFQQLQQQNKFCFNLYLAKAHIYLLLQQHESCMKTLGLCKILLQSQATLKKEANRTIYCNIFLLFTKTVKNNAGMTYLSQLFKNIRVIFQTKIIKRQVHTIKFLLDQFVMLKRQLQSIQIPLAYVLYSYPLEHQSIRNTAVQILAKYDHVVLAETETELQKLILNLNPLILFQHNLAIAHPLLIKMKYTEIIYVLSQTEEIELLKAMNAPLNIEVFGSIDEILVQQNL